MSGNSNIRLLGAVHYIDRQKRTQIRIQNQHTLPQTYTYIFTIRSTHNFVNCSIRKDVCTIEPPFK